MRDNFDDRYASKRRHAFLLRLGLRWRLRLVRPHVREGCRLLDVGAADGIMGKMLAGCISLSLIVNLERSLALAQCIPVNPVCASGTALPFTEQSFDVVICSATRKHIQDSLRLMNEIARVLRPGGRVIVIDPHPLLLRIGRRVGKFDPRYLYHLSSADQIREEFHQSGLQEHSRQVGVFVCCVGKKPALDGLASSSGAQPALSV